MQGRRRGLRRESLPPENGFGRWSIACLGIVTAHLACACIAGCKTATTRNGPGTAPSARAPRAVPEAPPRASQDTPAVFAVAARPAAEAEPDAAPRVYAKTRFVWIRPEPDASLQWIGYLSTGGSVRLRSDKPRFGPGCERWYAIEPRGYVCVDGDRATLDGADPVFRAERDAAPDVTSPWPHRYAESRGTPLYTALPSVEEQRNHEPDLRYHLRLTAHPDDPESKLVLAGVDLTPATTAGFALPRLPITAYEPRERLTPRSTVAYTREVRDGDRTFLLSHDLRWLPKDRVVPYPRAEFSGLLLDGDVKLPLAFFRGHDRPKYAKRGEHLEKTSETWPRLGWIALSGESVEQDGATYLVTRDGAHWVSKTDAVVPHPLDFTPWGARVGQPDTTGNAPPGRATWIEVSVWGGWLIAYEGTRPVFTTLISPGKGGTPHPGKRPIETASTPTGRFPISGKFVTATMEAPNEYIHSAVPWTQNFSGPYALHAAYWHDDWGLPKSGGCVNASPKDAKWLFAFTEPALPEGWHGVRWVPKLGPSTTLIVHD